MYDVDGVTKVGSVQLLVLAGRGSSEIWCGCHTDLT